MNPIVSVSKRVRPEFYDLDPMNIVWHGNYAKFFELTRVELLTKIGYGYEDMRLGGHMWPIVEMQTRYYRPLTYDQHADVEASMVEWENRLRINYVIRDAATRNRLTRGYTVQVAVVLETEEMLWETPAIFREKLKRFLA